MAKVLNGTNESKKIKQELQASIEKLKEKDATFQPKLSILQVGNRSDSNIYIKMKLKAGHEIGIDVEHIKLPETSTEEEVIASIEALNKNSSVHGIILQLPLDTINTMSEQLCTNTILPSKDVDGLTDVSSGKLSRGDIKSSNLPCTAKGVLHLLQQTGVHLNGKHASVIGRSRIVGMPVHDLLLWNNATVTICHSKTSNLLEVVRNSDVVVVAVGHKHLITKDMIKPGAVVIDCGINPITSDDGKRKLFGDVDYEGVAEIAGFITPVPGGVGPMTVAMLMQNTFECAVKQHFHVNSWQLKHQKVCRIKPVPSDSEIAMAQTPRKISKIAQEIGINDDELEFYGVYKAKINLKIQERLKNEAKGNYVVVTGITPTPLGEGKSTTTIGLAQALSAHLDTPTIACIRQPSMGPTFGIKGGAAGGGYSQVIPMDEFNMHLTGDIHAIASAHNLVAAAIDTRMFHENTQTDKALFNRLCPCKNGERQFIPLMLRRLQKLGINKSNPDDLTEEEVKMFARLNIDPETIMWNRVVDMNDRFLRKITIGMSPTEKGQTRDTQFDITVASELMAILALSTSLEDLKNRVGKIVVAYSKSGDTVTVDDLGATGAVTALLRDAVKPTLMQTLEGSPVMVHAGPFANIAHGNSSIIQDKIALKLVGKSGGFVLTEAGFGADIGGEKFFDIKCRYSGLAPNAAVLVCTVRALKMHGGGPNVVPGIPLAEEYKAENLELLSSGLCHLTKQIQNLKLFGVHVVVAINKFHTDSEAELALVKEHAIKAGAFDAQVASHWENAGEGAIGLGNALKAAVKTPCQFKFLYNLDRPLIEKMNTIVQKIYGGDGVIITHDIAQKLEKFTDKGYGKYPVCIAKTHLSLSTDTTLKGVPTGFSVAILDVRLSAGAGFVYPLAGKISTMPGLPTRPGFFNIDVDTQTGEITGLF